ncbi:hypothetical protein [Actinacidiphila rubida]|uniref:Uncharacterized protein n=1 Tax=Actinacidiphila rubida TaxID=310780 RepID=A0A1H8SXD9_9ACTN|nr:hypothetical protein [Actinacidiphila rubida]SEO83277.1 hypothetical protein SAMN05216267_104635 [Actinacidiphila rubida]
MICLTCRIAADAQAPADQHCDTVPGPGAACDCQHRTDRYRKLDGRAVVAQFYRWLDELTRPRLPGPDAICPCGGVQFAGRPIHNADCPWKNDPAPLRAVAAQALGEQPDAQPFNIRSWPAPKVTPCPCGGAVIDGEPIHAPDCPVHPVRLHVIEAAATAALPAELRAGGIHFAFEPTTED